MDEYAKLIGKFPWADAKASHILDFVARYLPDDDSGVFKFGSWVVLFGSYSERDAAFEDIAFFWAKAQAYCRRLPIGRSHGLSNWVVVIEADKYVAKVLKEARKFWNNTLKMYDDWIAEGKPEV